MKKIIKAALVVLVILIISVFAFSCVKITPSEPKETVKVLDDRFDLTNQVLNFIKDTYYDDIDYDMADVYAAYGLVGSLGDFNYIYSSEDLRGSAQDTKGFGLLLKVNMYNEHLVDFILPGSPFLTPSIYTSYLNSIPSDRAVKFTIKRGSETFDVSYQKIDFHFPYCIYVNDLPGVPEEFGYILLRTFDNSTNVLAEYKEAVASFNRDGNRALILDLRGNGGGSSTVLRYIASTLIGNDAKNSEALFEIHYAKENKSNYITSTTVDNKIDTPVYVLCNGGTASASEALIGTMKAHGTLTALIGQETVGKGVAQNGFTTYQEGEKGIFIDKGTDEDGKQVDLDLYLLQVIVGKYYIYDATAEGGKYCIHGNPFTPDIVVTGENPVTPDYGEDLYIEKAIEHYDRNK